MSSWEPAGPILATDGVGLTHTRGVTAETIWWHGSAYKRLSPFFPTSLSRLDVFDLTLQALSVFS